MSLEELTAELTKQINDLLVNVMSKEEKLSVLHKQASKRISIHERKTNDTLETLRKTRDEQVVVVCSLFV